MGEPGYRVAVAGDGDAGFLLIVSDTYAFSAKPQPPVRLHGQPRRREAGDNPARNVTCVADVLVRAEDIHAHGVNPATGSWIMLRVTSMS